MNVQMKKFLISLSLVSTLYISMHVTYAEPAITSKTENCQCDCEMAGLKIAYAVVEKTYIDEETGSPMAITKEDADGYWILEITPFLNETNEHAMQRYAGKEVAIGYVGDLEDDDSIEIAWVMPTSAD
jgi:hypothetical protein